MRRSNREKILDAAVDIVERDGMTAVTFESVAAESGLTKGGLLYHFPTREALLLAVHRHQAQEWRSRMVEAAGKEPGEATPDERLVAYARVTTDSVTRAELILLLESSINPDYARPWTEVLAEWTPSVADAERDPAAFARLVARLAADGLWLFEALSEERLTPELRRRIAEHIVRGISTPS